jgi:lipoate---protein ligase
MHIIINNYKDIYLNLALEEYLLRNRIEDICMLWQSEEAVVAGKHQNIMAEVNHAFIKKEKILPARRISGGGTVVHGEGNLNYTFIMNGEAGRLINFPFFITPVVEFLETLGISAKIGKRNDIVIDGIKISGNAEHVYRNRVLHHGTLLFNADIDRTVECLKVKPGQYNDKAVQSYHSEIGNISEFLTNNISFDEFVLKLNGFLLSHFKGATVYDLTTREWSEVRRLKESKYATPEWIFGYSPPFEANCTLHLPEGEAELVIKVTKNKIESLSTSAGRELQLLDCLNGALSGIDFSVASLERALARSGIDEGIREQLLQAFFR